ncbi:MAG: hypothetical protein HYX67_15695 [Candidatus Melainabacteria bacterium]|nr:hypothetical protein [Candidatus Melainabacteria bacterium]
MDEKKRTAKGIKLNASQLPLSNKADFVIGADSRKVLDNKIIENLGNTGSHGYFPSTVGRGYKSWSVSRELEIPSLPEDAEAQMRMIEGASAAEPLQNESESTASNQSDPFFMQGGAADSNPFAHEPKHAESPFESQMGTPAADPALAAQLQDTMRETLPQQTPSSTPAADPALAAQLMETVRETVPQKLPAQPAQKIDADAPSPWSGPVTDTQTPVVVRQHVTQSESQQWTESPWAGPVMDQQPPMNVSASQPPAPSAESVSQGGASDEGWVFVGEHQAAPVVEQANPIAQTSGPAVVTPSTEGAIIPSWVSAMASDVTAGSDLSEAAEEVNAAAAPVGDAVELETFLNSIPDEEFIIDNETMRHLFSSLCEPKTTSLKIKSPASDAADLAIAAAAAEILNTEVSIDEISIDDIATEEVLAAEVQTKFSAGGDQVPSDADFEAIQQAYAMLDLSPLPVSQRKEGGFDNVFDVVEKAAAEQTLNSEQDAAVDSSGNVSRTERGTIEMAIHVGGRQLVPQYNFCGMLTSVEMSDGLSFILSEEKNTWQMIEQSGKVMVSGIKSVSFDKQGNLSYVTKRGDTVTLKVDGTIDTKFAKKMPMAVPQEVSQEVVETETAPVASEMPVPPSSTAAPVDELELKSAQSAKSDKVPTSTKQAESDITQAKPDIKEAKPDTKQAKPGTKQAKPDTKQAKPDIKQAKADPKQAKSGVKPGKSDAKPQSKETKPAAKSTSKPKKKGR